MPASALWNELPHEYIITDGLGTKYYFSREEYTRHEFSRGSPGLAQTVDSIRYVSAWHLTKIKNIENDSIIFHYKTKGYKRVDYGGTQTQYFSSNENVKQYIQSSVSSSGLVHYYPEALTTIESSSALVRFEYNSTNDYITGLYVEMNDDMHKVIKRYKLKYDLFKGSERLMLKSVIDLSLENKDIDNINNTPYKGIPLYDFGYFGDGNLPFENSDQDFCGYYNAKGNYDCLVPQTSNIFMQTCGANRDVGIPAACYGSLTSITYPTGGKTLLEWESNSYSYLGNSPITKKSSTSETIIQTETLSYVNPPKESKLIIDNYTVGQNSEISMYLYNYFNFNPNELIDTEYYRSHEYNGTVEVAYPRVVFIDKSNNKVKALFYIDSQTVRKEAIHVPLSPGIYKIELRDPVNVDDTTESFLGWFHYENQVWGKIHICKQVTIGSSISTRKDYWGGLRIATIMSIANAESDTIVKEYNYTYVGDPNISNGVISTYPYYKSVYTKLASNLMTVPSILEAEISAYSSNGLYRTPLGAPSVEYKTVWEHYSGVLRIPGTPVPNGPLNNLLVEYNYSSCYDYGTWDYNSDNRFQERQPRGAQMWTSKAHRRGLLLNKTIKNMGGGTINTSTNYQYNIFENPDLNTFTTDLFKVADYTRFPIAHGGAYENLYGICKYHLIPYNRTIAEEENTVYHGDTKFINKVNYTYFYTEYTDNKDYGLVKSKIITNAEGKIKEIFYTYLNSGSGFLNIPETEIEVVDGIIVSAKRMEYNLGAGLRTLKAVYGLNTRGVQASAYSLGSSKETSSKLKNLINKPEYAYRYDNEGNLAEIRYNGEVMASYLWGYRGAFPIAEIKGLPYDTLLAEIHKLGVSCPESLLSSTAYSEPFLSNFLKDLRNLFPSHDVITMSYHWLIGVSTATDSRGITTHFTYDDFGRLSDVKDYNQYFIRKYDYHHIY